MKKTILLPLMLLYGITFSQTSFGLKAGYSLSNIKAKYEGTTSNYDAKSSFYLGGLVERKLNEKFSLQGELLYSQLGGSTSFSTEYLHPYIGTLVTIDDQLTYNTLQIPLSGKYYINPQFALGAGFNFNFIISGKVSSEVRNTNTNELLMTAESDTDNSKGFFLAPFLGAEYNITDHIFLDARYNLGITNISKYDEFDEKINFFQIGIGYKFK